MDHKMFLKAVCRTVFIVVNNLYAIPAFIGWTILLLPFKYIKPRFYWFIEGHLFHWLLLMVSNWLWTGGYSVAETGDDLSQFINDKCLVVANHQSTGDVPTLMYCFSDKPGLCNKMMWIMDILFKYTNFGFVSQIHQDFFIQQGKATRKQQLVDLKKHLTEVYQKKEGKWLILFPEGGFLRKRKETSKRYGEKYGYPTLHHVTLPRTGAMEVILNTLTNRCHKTNGFTTTNGFKHSPSSNKIKWLVDVTIAYPNATPLDAFCITFGHRSPCKTTVLYRIYPIDDIPLESTELQQWLFKRWEEKDQILDEFYKTGQFSSMCRNTCIGEVKNEEKLVEISTKRVIPMHLFYMASTYLQYYVFKYLLGFIWM